jgi:hypothetical protein
MDSTKSYLNVEQLLSNLSYVVNFDNEKCLYSQAISKDQMVSSIIEMLCTIMPI